MIGNTDGIEFSKGQANINISDVNEMKLRIHHPASFFKKNNDASYATSKIDYILSFTAFNRRFSCPMELVSSIYTSGTQKFNQDLRISIYESESNRDCGHLSLSISENLETGTKSTYAEMILDSKHYVITQFDFVDENIKRMINEPLRNKLIVFEEKAKVLSCDNTMAENNHENIQSSFFKEETQNLNQSVDSYSFRSINRKQSNQPTRWVNCFPGDHTRRTRLALVHIIIDYGVYLQYNSNEAEMNTIILPKLKIVSDTYQQQIGVAIDWKIEILQNENTYPNITGKSGQKCETEDRKLLDRLLSHYKSRKKIYENTAAVLLFTNCNFGPDGIAYVASLCGYSRVGIVSHKSRDILAYITAHELGHLFGSHHSFESVARGGIMDYNADGYWNNMFQFRIDLRRAEICRYLTKISLDQTKSKICIPWNRRESARDPPYETQQCAYRDFTKKEIPFAFLCDGVYDSKNGDDESPPVCENDAAAKCPPKIRNM